MRITIRDDDISYFTSINQLEKVYSKAWKRGFKAHLAVIPFVKSPGTAVPKQDRKKRGIYPIGKNQRLVQYLKKRIHEGKIVIMQHGMTHEDFGGEFEMEQFKIEDCPRLKEGKRYLEKVFGKEVDTFVAPHDRFSRAAVTCVERAGFHYISRCFAPLPREVRLNPSYIRSYCKLVFHFLRYRTSRKYPTPLSFGRHTALFSYRLEELRKIDLKELCLFHKEGVFSLTIHSKGMDAEQIRFFNEVLTTLEGSR